MNKTTKLWISDKLELRYHPDGWPTCPQRADYMDTAAYLSACESYNRDLAKMKEKSILVESLKARILEAFKDRCKEMNMLQMMWAEVELAKVLDELGIN